MTIDLNASSIKQLSQALNQKKLSSLELVQYYLSTINQHNSELNACVHINNEAINIAKAIDARRSSQPDSLHLLAGIPIIHKDNFCTIDAPTTCCSRMLQGYLSPFNATMVENLTQAGMITLAKANMDEFAMGGSNENSIFGPCRNPWDLDRVPGGSSGGSAAAVAAGFAPVSTGSDTGGSIRQPAAYCGITGLKPTYGLISRFGMVAFASTLDQAGPLARSAEDIAYLLDTMASYDPEKDMSSENPPETSKQYIQNLNDPIKSIKVGLPKEYFEGSFSKPVQQCIDNCLETLKSMGLDLIEVTLPDVKHCVSAYYTIAPCEASSNLARFDGGIYGHRSKTQGADIDGFFMANRSEGFGQEVKRRLMIGTYALSSGYYDQYYTKAQNVRNLIRHDFTEAFKHVDVILAPTTSTTAFKIGELIDDPVSMYQQDLYTIPVNLAELPSISFPVGLADGLPFGMQFIGPKWSESKLLNLTHQLQSVTQWHQALPKSLVQTRET